MNTFRTESSDPRHNAQRNLDGRTHYCSDDTLRFHKSRILSTYIVDDGLLLAIVESCSLDMHNVKRGFRPVIFDIFGEVLSRPDLEHSFNSKEKAIVAMWAELNKIDAKAHTLQAIDKWEQHCIKEAEKMREELRHIRERLTSQAA